jgi:hypothetical protein
MTPAAPPSEQGTYDILVESVGNSRFVYNQPIRGLQEVSGQSGIILGKIAHGPSGSLPEG